MKQIIIGNTFRASQISLGCMRIFSKDKKEVNLLLNEAVSQNINLFDHADIYGGGESEKMFAKALPLTPSMRDKILIQTKCGIRDGYYDFSKEHILNSVDGSLKRLNTEYIDILLLHRPDTLMEPEEVAEAFNILKQSGKVRYFGVSNQNPMQIELLNEYLEDKILINQLRLSIINSTMIDSGFNVNVENDGAVVRDGGILEYSRLKKITIQAWSPFIAGFSRKSFINNSDYKELNDLLNELGQKYNATAEALAIAWILRHPANIQPIVGTTQRERLIKICKACDINLTREEFYLIYKAAGKKIP